ncbi:MAG: 1-aminocyclopropane-1-carboxylate deaminase/D-cysteine desulfhydrase [Promethearchaeota archaeon]
MKRPPLFERFNALQKHIPWISILEKPTPVRQLTNLQKVLKTKEALWVKLDNLTSKAYGGNKVRKLEFLLADALQQDKHTIVTMGGLGTNHGLATTIHGRTQNLHTRIYIEDQPLTLYVLQNLKLMYYYGAELIYTKTRWRTALRFNLFDRLRWRGVYWLPTGGSTPVGVLGYLNAVFELRNQIQAGLLPEPRLIFVAAGSVGTISGIELGLQLTGLNSRVIGIQVTSNPRFNQDRVKNLVHKTLRLLTPGIEVEKIHYEPRFELSNEFLGRGYGYPTKAGNEALEMALEFEQLHLDPTYTAKTFAGVIDYLRKGKQGPILYWHTLNSVDLSDVASQVDYHDLPSPFHQFFDGSLLGCTSG